MLNNRICEGLYQLDMKAQSATLKREEHQADTLRSRRQNAAQTLRLPSAAVSALAPRGERAALAGRFLQVGEYVFL